MYLSVVEPPDVATLYAAIEKNVEKKLPLMLAVVGETVVGWCSVARNYRVGFEHSGILSIGVNGDYRGQGLGKRLLRETVERARAIGISRIELDVFASNTVAIDFYVNHNFALEGRKRNARCLNGVYDDVICMALFEKAKEP